MAVVLTTIACSTSDSTSGGGGGGGATTDGGASAEDGGRAEDASASPPGDAEGPTAGVTPCKSGDQRACQACVDAAAKTCSASLCKQEDLDLQNCSVMSVYVPCEDQYGNPSIDCCEFEQQMLIRCWNRCPDMLACG